MEKIPILLQMHASKSGRIMVKALMLIVLFFAALAVLFYFLNQFRRTTACAGNLKNIYHAMELYETERGSLPRLAFFPDDPKEDADSLRKALEVYGVDARACVCPAAPSSQAELGLTYIWNVQLNGLSMPHGGEPIWMLVEMNALSADVPAPHLGSYNVLYSDGTVHRIRHPLQDLQGL